MSQSQPANKDELKDFCLRQLGYPVVQINVDDVQVDDAVELAFEYWNEFHFNGTERTYVKHLMTEQDMTNKYVTVSDSLIGATRVLKVGGNKMAMNMFDLRYQLRLNDLWDLSSTSYVNYSLTMQHLATLDLIFTGETPIRFNRLTNKLYIEMDWGADIQAGEYIIIEGFVVTDPSAYTRVWNDRLLKKLAVAYVKKQWGVNMKKYAGMQLPGGITMNGQQIFDEAVKDIAEVEQNIRDTYEAPPEFLVG
jgi:hypothetical protein